ncbi:MAG TPA: DUF2330 domain-containing protein [Polyangia bacterium]|nr:DUF2330 domain-containing protein [Polyangia bacterium]
MKRLIPVLAFCASLFAARVASACGGFFCSRAPIDQSGEKILFAVDSSGIEVHVQISYTGSDADFAWVVPTRQVPTLSVGSDAVFSALAQRTAPQFNLRYHAPGFCGFGGEAQNGSPGFSAASDLGVFAGDGGAPPVNVISQSTVGPYDSVVLQSSDPKALATWLRSNNYNLTPEAEVLIDPYVVENDYFVALKLHAGATATDIQPIVLHFAGSEPCVPLRLTAVAAINNMEVTAFLLGSARAVPTNFYEVRPNWLRIDWRSGGYNYKQVVSEAALEAGGNAFVTEFAGSSSVVDGAFDTSRYDLALLRSTTDPIAYVQILINEGFTGNSLLLDILRKWIPEPQSLISQGVPEQSFYNNLSFYRDALAGFAFDPVGMTDDINMKIVAPLQSAAALFARLPYLTRLFTEISPAQMTKDPTFAYNSELPDVSNLHTADGYYGCNYDDPVKIVLDDGRYVYVDNTAQSTMLIDSMPAAESWYQMGPTGLGTLVGTNDKQINNFLAQHGFSGSGGCTVAPSGSPLVASLALLAATGALWLGLRRRRRSA